MNYHTEVPADTLAAPKAARAPRRQHNPMHIVRNFDHQVGSHCETGTTRNLLRHAGLDVSEPMIFGIGSGPAFYYLFFVKGPTTMPLIGLRNTPGGIIKRVGKRCGIDFRMRQYRSSRAAVEAAYRHIDQGTPVAAQVEMFRMKYLPSHMRVRAPFHFVALAGREGDVLTVSDPYHSTLNPLDRADLEAGWETNAPMAKDNLLVYVRRVPGTIDWKRAAHTAIRATCREMLIPRPLDRLFFFVGTAGMRTFARTVRAWAKRYRGVRLREGMLFHAVGFEDQGTGGGAFRLMYGAFLQEIAERFRAPAIGDIAQRCIEHGRAWRRTSRRIVELARPIPMEDERYEDWHGSHGRELQEGLDELASQFEQFADFEQQMFADLRRSVRELA